MQGRYFDDLQCCFNMCCMFWCELYYFIQVYIYFRFILRLYILVTVLFMPASYRGMTGFVLYFVYHAILNKAL